MGLRTRCRGSVTVTSVPLRNSDCEIERAAVQVDEVLHDRQSETGAALGGFVGQRALTEGLQDARDLVFRNTGASVGDRHELSAVVRMSDDERDAAALRRELQRVGQEVEADLAHRARIGPDVRQIRREVFDDLQRLGVGFDFDQTLAILGDVREAGSSLRANRSGRPRCATGRESR